MPTRSVSSNPEVETVEAFDEAWQAIWDEWFDDRQYSRSQAIEEAMKLSTAVLNAWEDAPGDLPENGHTLRLYTDDAIQKRVDYHDLTK